MVGLLAEWAEALLERYHPRIPVVKPSKVSELCAFLSGPFADEFARRHGLELEVYRCAVSRTTKLVVGRTATIVLDEADIEDAEDPVAYVRGIVQRVERYVR